MEETESAAMLWSPLQYIVDFYCKEIGLVIEIDGYSHGFEKDLARQADLENMGLRVLRFSESDVRKDIGQVLRAIESFVGQVKKSP